MTPGMLHDFTVAKALKETESNYMVKGDGTPETTRGEDEKDLQYWSLGRMMMHHRNLKGGFDKLFIAGLPAFRAIQNMQCLTGSGLTVPVESYTGVEMDPKKLLKMSGFYERFNGLLPQYRKIPVELLLGNILDALPNLDQKFNVFDFDFMCSPNGWTAHKNRAPTDRVVLEKTNSFIFLKAGEMDRIINTVKVSRRKGPTAVYCNWALGRQMSQQDWETLRRGILKRFQMNFVVESYRWTQYFGNSHMRGIQMILGDTKIEAKEPRKEQVKEGLHQAKKLARGGTFTVMDRVDGKRIRAMRNKLGISQETLAKRLGVSQFAISRWERYDAGRMTQRYEAVVKLRKMLKENAC